MARDPRAYLWDMLEAANAVGDFLTGETYQTYLADKKLRSAVERQMQNIGEALTQLSKVEPSLAAQIDNQAGIIGLRNVLVHGYVSVRSDRVWAAVQTNVPGLRIELSDLLTKLGPPDPP